MWHDFRQTIGQFGLRHRGLSRLAGWSVVCLVCLLVLFRIALPLFVSTASVKENMEKAISSWAGAHASIAENPEISFWPSPVLTLSSLKIEGGDGPQPQLLASARSISAGFDILAALSGKPVFYNFHLVDPVFNIERAADGELNWRRAAWVSDALTSGTSGGLQNSLTTPIGKVLIENGAVTFTDQSSGITRTLTAISGTVDWPTPSSAIRAQISATINNETLVWNFDCASPLMLFSGTNSAFLTSITTAKADVSFEGSGNFSRMPFASGNLRASAPSIAALGAWFELAPDIISADTGAFSLDTALTLNGRVLKMDALELSIGQSDGTGVLDFEWPETKRPRGGGTLAFDTLDTRTLLPSIARLLPGSGAVVDDDFLDRFRLDLRLSAQKATIGALSLDNLAAGVMVENGRASVDIGDSDYAGGSLSGRLAIADRNAGKASNFRLSLRNADLATPIADLGLTGPLPTGRGSITLDLSSKALLRDVSAQTVSGSFRLGLNNGLLGNFNMETFEALASKGAFFRSSEASNGGFPFASAIFEATLDKGTARLDKAVVEGDGRTLSLSGIVPYRDGGLALAGLLKSSNPAASTVRFFVGGAWPDPVITPLSVLVAPQ